MNWQKEAKRIYNDDAEYTDLCKMLCKMQKENYGDFHLDNGFSYRTKSILHTIFVWGAMADNEKVIRDMELLFKKLKEWRNKNAMDRKIQTDKTE